MNLRSTDRLDREGRPIPRHCEDAGCGRATRAGKPYCPAHVDLHPYVQQLKSEIALRESEVAKVARRGRVATWINRRGARVASVEALANEVAQPSAAARASGGAAARTA